MENLREDTERMAAEHSGIGGKFPSQYAKNWSGYGGCGKAGAGPHNDTHPGTPQHFLECRMTLIPILPSGELGTGC